MTLSEDMCPTCGSDAAVTAIAAPDGGKLYTCFFSHDGSGHMSWQIHKGTAVGLSNDGVTAELAHPFEQLLADSPHVFVEYGVLEYRLRTEFPKLFASHVAARGHVLTGAKQATASSVRFSAALLRLDRAGVATYEMRAATVAWSYNAKVGFWALVPPPEPGAVLTWSAYCEQVGRSPEWQPADYAEVTAMAGAAEPAH